MFQLWRRQSCRRASHTSGLVDGRLAQAVGANGPAFSKRALFPGGCAHGFSGCSSAPTLLGDSLFCRGLLPGRRSQGRRSQGCVSRCTNSAYRRLGRLVDARRSTGVQRLLRKKSVPSVNCRLDFKVPILCRPAGWDMRRAKWLENGERETEQNNPTS